MDQFKPDLNHMGLSESPSASWLDYQSFNAIKSEDEDFNMEIIRTSDLEKLMELENIPEVQEPVQETTDEEELKQSIMSELFPEEEVKQDEFDTNNTLIAEVEKYLTSVSGETTRIEEDILAMAWEDFEAEADNFQSEPIMLPVKQAASMDADHILDALTTGQVIDDSNDSPKSFFPSSFEALDAHGDRVIIMIAPPSPATSTMSAAPSDTTQDSLFLAPGSPAYSEALSPACSSGVYSPGSSSATLTSDDDEWRPSPSAGAPRPRKKYERKAPKQKPDFSPYPKDKAERKKAQNRSAAWKYREKKKVEQELAEKEFDILLNRNMQLKKTLSDMEIQLNCLKDLIMETGMASKFNQ